jgi:hypothetical protein
MPNVPEASRLADCLIIQMIVCWPSLEREGGLKANPFTEIAGARQTLLILHQIGLYEFPYGREVKPLTSGS